jgi:hypothetical protein
VSNALTAARDVIATWTRAGVWRAAPRRLRYRHGDDSVRIPPAGRIDSLQACTGEKDVRPDPPPLRACSRVVGERADFRVRSICAGNLPGSGQCTEGSAYTWHGGSVYSREDELEEPFFCGCQLNKRFLQTTVEALRRRESVRPVGVPR